MTCIVGLRSHGRVYLASDSAGVGGLNLVVRADAKVFRNGEFLIGFTSSFRMGQILAYLFTPPPLSDDEDMMMYMVRDFVRAARGAMKDAGFLSKRDDVESGGTFLVAHRRGLFRICDDFQVAISTHDFDAIGCGADYALGSLHSTSSLLASPEARIRSALDAAESFSAGVRGPFSCMSLP